MKSLRENLICINCGGTVEYIDERHAKCPFCNKQYEFKSTLSDNAIINYSLATEYWKTFRFADAKRKFHDVTNESNEYTDAYFGAFLSEYGIEWEKNRLGVDVPTCHRAHTQSVYDNVDYQKAIEYATSVERENFLSKAERIERVRKRIIDLPISETYDVFICFKAQDNGHLTEDSYLGKKIYEELKEEGYSVFFSSETLLDVPESEFEPYIFKALSSSRVLLLLCSSIEKIESPWVKNEWDRFYDMHNGQGLVPICGNRLEQFSPNSLPLELRKFQAIEYDGRLFENIKRKVESYFPERQEEKRRIEQEKLQEEIRRQAELLLKERELLEEESKKRSEELKKVNEKLDEKNDQKDDSTSSTSPRNRSFKSLISDEFKSFKNNVISDVKERIFGSSSYEYEDVSLDYLLIDLKLKSKEDLKSLESSDIILRNRYYQKIRKYGSKSLNDELDSIISEIDKKSELRRKEKENYKKIADRVYSIVFEGKSETSEINSNIKSIDKTIKGLEDEPRSSSVDEKILYYKEKRRSLEKMLENRISDSKAFEYLSSETMRDILLDRHKDLNHILKFNTKSLKVGDLVFFGEQSSPILWKVERIDFDECTLVSKDIIKIGRYIFEHWNDEGGKRTVYKKAHDFLNSTFTHQSFKEYEKKFFVKEKESVDIPMIKEIESISGFFVDYSWKKLDEKEGPCVYVQDETLASSNTKIMEIGARASIRVKLL